MVQVETWVSYRVCNFCLIDWSLSI
jgi:hypothetical protein